MAARGLVREAERPDRQTAFIRPLTRRRRTVLSGVRASIVAMRPLTRAEPRDAGPWMREGKKDARQTGDSAREGCTTRREPGRPGAALPLAVDRIIDLDRSHAGGTARLGLFELETAHRLARRSMKMVH